MSSWLRDKVGTGLNQMASAAAAGASAVQQGAAAAMTAGASMTAEPQRQGSNGRWSIEVMPNPETQTLDVKLVDKKRTKKNESKSKNAKKDVEEGKNSVQGSAAGEEENWAIAWPPTVLLNVVHRHYNVGLPPTQVEDRIALGELQRVSGPASAADSGDGPNMFTCTYGPVLESVLVESAAKAAAAASNLDSGASYLPRDISHVLECAVSIERVASLSIPVVIGATDDGGAVAAFDVEFEDGGEFEGEFDPLPADSPAAVESGVMENPGAEEGGPIAIASESFKLDGARPILQVTADPQRNTLCLNIRGVDKANLSWPASVDLGPRGLSSAATAGAAEGYIRLAQAGDRPNEYAITPEAVSAFPAKKPAATVTAAVGISLSSGGASSSSSSWALESALCSPAAAAPRLRVTADPALNCLIVSIDGLAPDTPVVFPDCFDLAFGMRRRTVQLEAGGPSEGSGGGTRRYPVTPALIDSAHTATKARGYRPVKKEHTVHVKPPKTITIGGVAWSGLESNYFSLEDAKPQLQVIPCPDTRLLRLSILGTLNEEVQWPQRVSLKYQKISHRGAHLVSSAIDIERATDGGSGGGGAYPGEATFGPITDEVLAEVDCRPYTNGLKFATDVVVRGVSWSHVSLSSKVPLRVRYGLDPSLFLYHVLSCNGGGDAFSARCRQECWRRRADNFFAAGGGVAVPVLQICRDQRFPTRGHVAAKALMAGSGVFVDLFAPQYSVFYKGLVAAQQASKYGAATFLLRKDIQDIVSVLTKVVEDESANIAGLTMEDLTFGFYYLLATTRGEWGQDQAAIEAEHKGCGDVTDSELARVQWMHNLATWAYVEDLVDLQQLVHHQGFEIIVCTPGNAKSRPAFHVLAHQQLKLVVVTVRGTKDFKDVLSDLDCKPTPFTMPGQSTSSSSSSEHYAHEGMNDAADWLISETIEILRLFVGSGFAPVLTGHSLGGGVATLATAKLAPEFGKAGLRCYGYGNPPVVTAALATAARAHTVSVCHEHDVVPRLSSANVSRLLVLLCSFREHFQGKEVALGKDVARGFLASKFGGVGGTEVSTGGSRSGSSSSSSSSSDGGGGGGGGGYRGSAVRGAAAVALSTPQLKIPGRIIHVYKVEGVYRAKEAPDFDFAPLSRIEPYLDMVECHSNKPYKAALESARTALALGSERPRVPWTGFEASVESCACCGRDFCWAEAFTSPTQRDLVGRVPCGLCGKACCPKCTSQLRPLPFLGKPMPTPVCKNCFYLPPPQQRAVPKW